MNRHRATRVALVAAVVIFTIVFTWLSTARYHALFTHDPRDEAVNNQLLYNTAHGHLVFSTIKGDMRFHKHFRPIFFPLALPYLVHPGPPAFYFSVALLLALGALAAFGLGRHLFGDDRLALLAALGWLLFPPVHELAMGNLDPETVAATFWLAAFTAFVRRLPGWFWVFAMLGVISKETHAPILAAFGVLALIERRSWTWIAPPILVGSLWFIVAVKWIVPYFNPEFPLVFNRLAGVDSPDFWGDLWRTLTTDPGRIPREIYNPEDAYLFGKLLLTGLLLPLLAPLAVLPAGTIVLQIAMHKDPLPVRQAHMLAGLIPFVFAATLAGIARLGDWLGRRKTVAAVLLSVLLAWSLWSAGRPGVFGPGRDYGHTAELPTTLYDPWWYEQTDADRRDWALMATVPPLARAMTNSYYLLPMSTRPELREFGNQGNDLGAYDGIDYILLGLRDWRCLTCTYARLTADGLRTATELIETGRFALERETPEAVVLRRSRLPGPSSDDRATEAALERLRGLAEAYSAGRAPDPVY